MSDAAGTDGLILCLDTSTDASVALVRQGTVLARRRSGSDRRHAETLVPMIAAALTQAGAGPDDVDAVVVGTGPAPFTGLRVGLATARTFAQARGIEVFGVCSLDALALAAGPGPVLVVTDAKRRELYYARYQVGADDVQVLAGPDVAAPERIADAHGDLIAVGRVHGPGLIVAAERLGAPTPDAAEPVAASDSAEAPVVVTDPVDPVHLARIAERRRVTGGELSLTPLYLRRPDVHPAPVRKRAR